MFISDVFRAILKYRPAFGSTNTNSYAITHHIRQAIKHSRSAKELTYNIASNPDTPRNLADEMVKIIQKHKDTPDLAFKAYMKQKADMENSINFTLGEETQVELIGKNAFENAKNARNNPKGLLGELKQSENFNIVSESKPKTDYNAKLDLAPNVRDLSKLTTDEITADLEYLANKHPEIFNKPSEVFKLIREIKDNPTHYFNNYRLDASLIVKRLNDNKIGKMAVKKDSGEVIHATKVRERDLGRMDRVSRQMAETSTLSAPLKTADKMPLKQDANSVGETYSSAANKIIPKNGERLQNVNERELGAGSPYPTLQRAENISGRTDGDGVKTHSLAANDIIPQTAKIPDELQEAALKLKSKDDIIANEELTKGNNNGNNQREQPNSDELYQRGNSKIRGQGESRPSDERISKQDGSDDVGRIQEPNQEARTRGELKDDTTNSLASDGDAYGYARTGIRGGNELRDRRIHAGYDTKNARMDESRGQTELANVKYTDEERNIAAELVEAANKIKAAGGATEETNKALDKALKKAASEYYGTRNLEKSALYALKPAIATESDINALFGISKKQIQETRTKLENEANITPIKEFGVNYAEYYRDGANAVKKLLSEKQGQVAGAFYKEGLGDIDLVWGNENFGLVHILKRRSEQWGEEKAERFVLRLGEIINEATVAKGKDDTIELISPKSTIILAKNGDNKFIITAFRDSGNKKKLESGSYQTFHDDNFADKSVSARK